MPEALQMDLCFKIFVETPHVINIYYIFYKSSKYKYKLIEINGIKFKNLTYSNQTFTPSNVLKDKFNKECNETRYFLMI
jgi:hypothetical protein